jgi:elongator complex protein 4
VRILALPAPHTLAPPSDRHSALRGLGAAGGGGGGAGGGENNLAFKCMRRRMVVETLHLDAEGGVGERRTAPPVGDAFAGLDAPAHAHAHVHVNEGGGAKVEVGIERGEDPGRQEEEAQVPVKPKKAKKSVAFRSDRPELYDF